MKKGRVTVAVTGIIVGVAYAGWRAYRARVPESTGDGSWQAAPFPFPPIPRPAAPRVTPEDSTPDEP